MKDNSRYEITVRDKITGIEAKFDSEHVDIGAERGTTSRYDVAIYKDVKKPVSRGVVKFWSGLKSYDEFENQAKVETEAVLEKEGLL